MNPINTWLGYPYPLGATVMTEGVNFAVYSEHATGVELCLFDSPDADHESFRIPMAEQTDEVWHVFLPDVKPGQLYGFRVDGLDEPEQGLRFNPAKLLIDPYAKSIAGQVTWNEAAFGYPFNDPQADLARNDLDSAWCVPKSVVVDPAFDWSGDHSPRRPLRELSIYEMHVVGFTKLCPELPPEIRGTYAGVGSEFAINYLKRLGVNTIELMPVHQHVDDSILEDRGLSNYWGYNTIGFFSPECTYSSSGVLGGQVTEFKRMVKSLHAAGIEVLLDVVYNHTAEGNHLGPTLSFKGIDNLSYYRLVDDQRRYYMDYTGTGNTLNLVHPRVLQLVMDSLRYWVLEMHVDGFRFDLASTLAREFRDVTKLAAFFDVIHQDPVLSQVKLIAEPWDVGEGGYQVGNFPVLWSEWNGRYRDAIRRYWKGDEGHIGELGYRLTGSPDLYQTTGKRPYASINFVTAHDGFTLNDLVSYNEKHNEANGENNQDGDNNQQSWNCGAEGPTDDETVLALRRRQRRNFLGTLLLSQGVPMLCAGDEFGRTQGGNNNAYCQDNEISWFSWKPEDHDEQLFEFTRKLISLRRDHPVLRRPKFFQGRKIRGSDIRDIMWFNPAGDEMTDEEWQSAFVRTVGVLMSGDTLDVRTFKNEPIKDDTFLLLFNAHHEPVGFSLPGDQDVNWEMLVDTADDEGFFPKPKRIAADAEVTVTDRSLCVMRQVTGSQEKARHGARKKQSRG